jgi:hypothetical protein
MSPSHRANCQIIKYLLLIGTVCVWSSLLTIQGRGQCAARHSVQHALTYWQRPLPQLPDSCHEILNSPGRHYKNTFRCLQRKRIRRILTGRRKKSCNHNSKYNPASWVWRIQLLLDTFIIIRCSSIVLKLQFLPHSLKHIFKQPSYIFQKFKMSLNSELAI